MTQYDDITSRYTALYPEVGQAENQIIEILRKMRVAVESELNVLTNEVSDLRIQEGYAIHEPMKFSVDQKTDNDQRSNYGLFQRLYEDMKTKLEQAKIAQELGKDAEKSFIIIDPARVPAKPSKPNRTMIIGGGVVFGLILGLALTMIAELFDTRVRSARDLEMYNLPVIGLLPDVRRE